MGAAITTTYVADTTCPYCFLGHASLLRATNPQNVSWSPMLLDAAGTLDGMPWTAYLDTKFVDESIWRPLLQTLSAQARQYGRDLRWDKIRTHPGARDSHRVILWAGRQSAELQQRVAAAIMSALWEHGVDISDRAALVSIARQTGMETRGLRQRLASYEDCQTVATRTRQARELGIRRVPTVVVSGSILQGFKSPSGYLEFFAGLKLAA